MRLTRLAAASAAATVGLALAACTSPNLPTTHGPDALQRPNARNSARETIAHSRRGAPIVAETFIPSGQRRAEGPVLVIACIHGDELEGLAAIEAVRAEAAAAQVPVVLVENMNPDGTAARTRGNAAEVDLNRNWPTSNFRKGREHGPAPLSEPETLGVYNLLERASPSLVIVLHSTRSGPFVNFDGPAGKHASRFVAAAREVDPRWRVVPEMGYPTPGSLGTMVGDERAIPILTIEMQRGDFTAMAREALGVGLGAVLSGRAGSS